jgi:hypothetical protein
MGRDRKRTSLFGIEGWERGRVMPPTSPIVTAEKAKVFIVHTEPEDELDGEAVGFSCGLSWGAQNAHYYLMDEENSAADAILHRYFDKDMLKLLVIDWRFK